MGTASSSMVINLPPTSSSSSSSSQPAVDGASSLLDALSSSPEPVIDDASKPPSPSSSEPAIDDVSKSPSSSSSESVMSKASSPSSLSSGDPLVDGNIKTFFSVIGCKDKLKKVDSLCGLEHADDRAAATMDAEACAKAVAAMRKCVQARATLYEGYVRDDTDKQQQQESKIEA